MDERHLIYAPRAQRDLFSLPKRNALQILEDLEILRQPPWPPGKVKKLYGIEFWEIKTSDYRTIFWIQGRNIVILRVVHRKELERTLGRLDIRRLVQWWRNMVQKSKL